MVLCEGINTYYTLTHLSVRIGLNIDGNNLPNSFYPIYEVPTYEFLLDDGDINYEVPPKFLLDEDHKPDYSGI